MFKTSKGVLLNTDVNGAYNIMKKAFPNAIMVDEIEAFGLMPKIIQQNIVDTIIWNKMSIFLLVLMVLMQILAYNWKRTKKT